MLKRGSGIVLLVTTVLCAIAGTAFGAECRVADPTGTPLNVRVKPQGSIVSSLDNGVTVVTLEQGTLGGKRWAKVAADGAVLGWVFSAYLHCQATDDSRKSAPMRPRMPPP